MSLERVYSSWDLENLIGSSRHTEFEGAAIAAVAATVRRLGERGIHLGGVAVCDRDLQARTAWELAEVGVRVHACPDRGPNAADLALIGWLHGGLPVTTTTVVIGSGDHIFAPIATELVVTGRRVIVVSRRGSLSRALESAASEVVLLDEVGTGDPRKPELTLTSVVPSLPDTIVLHQPHPHRRTTDAPTREETE